MNIKPLDSHLVNLIAAGEVIERPVSVVRELVDNAVDAGCTDVRVEIVEGGLRSVQVSDNGSGIAADELALALERHATSKVQKEEDLVAISTRGFRGEALASISACAEMVLASRTRNAPVGTAIVSRFGVAEVPRAQPMPVGTVVTVSNLFGALPARRKFLKSPRAEEMKIKSVLRAMALGSPQVHVRLVADGKEVLNLPPRASVLERAQELVKGTSVTFTKKWPGLTISGVVAHPTLAQTRLDSLTIVVNGRVVTDRALVRATRDGFESTVKGNEVPLGVISITIDPPLVDVNVHPQKSEVRFRDPQAIFLAVRSAVRAAVQEFRGPEVPLTPSSAITFPVIASPSSLSASSPFSSLGSESPVPDRGLVGAAGVRLARSLFPPSSVTHSIGEPSQSYESRLTPSTQTRLSAEAPIEPPALTLPYSQFDYKAQLLGCYLVCEWQSHMYVIDMHAAHERINYNRIRSAFQKREVSSQRLLIPEVIELSDTEIAVLEQSEKILSDFGFVVELAGEHLNLLEVPSWLREGRGEKVIREVLASELSPHRGIEAELDRICARLACHGSIRGGDGISPEQARALLRELETAVFAGACPHGRPICAVFTREEIERWFGRDH